MNWTSVLLWVMLIVQSLVIFWLWRRIDLLESANRVEATSHEHLQRQLSAVQRNIQDIAVMVQASASVAQLAPSHSQPLQSVASVTEGASPYSQAIELFKRGLGAHDVAERCGISRSEAELILSLYRNSPAS